MTISLKSPTSTLLSCREIRSASPSRSMRSDAFSGSQLSYSMRYCTLVRMSLELRRTNSLSSLYMRSTRSEQMPSSRERAPRPFTYRNPVSTTPGMDERISPWRSLYYRTSRRNSSRVRLNYTASIMLDLVVVLGRIIRYCRDCFTLSISRRRKLYLLYYSNTSCAVCTYFSMTFSTTVPNSCNHGSSREISLRHPGSLVYGFGSY